MKQRHAQHWPCILLALALTAGTAATASAYTRPTTKPPTGADICLINGHAGSMAVRILNLTPYDIVEDMSFMTVKGSTDLSRGNHDPMMFAPVGWPIKLPKVPGTWQQDPGTLAWAFKPDSPNEQVHPYSFAVAWNDQGTFQTESTMGWTIKGVYTKTHGPQTKDVKLGMWFSREKPSDKLLGADFKFITSCVVQFVDVIGVALDPANPIAWLDVFVATKELKNSAFEVANSDETGGTKMYFASYALPETGEQCDKGGTNCDLGTVGNNNDAVSAQWTDTQAGDYASPIVVTTHMLRGDDVSESGSGFGCCGSAPIVMVAVWTSDEWEYARTATPSSPLTADPEGRKINNLLRQRKMQGYLQFAKLYNSLDPDQARAYGTVFTSLKQHHSLTVEQKGLLKAMATALEKGHTSLKGEQIHERPSHPPHK